MTTLWACVGSGLRIQLMLLGPGYAMEFNSLGTGLKTFMSRAVTGSHGEDLVEKQNAQQGRTGAWSNASEMARSR